MIDKEEFAERFNQQMNALNLNIHDVVYKMGVSTATVHSQRKGKSKPKMASIYKLKKILGMDIVHLLGETDKNDIVNLDEVMQHIEASQASLVKAVELLYDIKQKLK